MAFTAQDVKKLREMTNVGMMDCKAALTATDGCQRNGNLTGAINTTATGGTGAFASREAAEKTAKEKFNVELL